MYLPSKNLTCVLQVTEAIEEELGSVDGEGNIVALYG
jgi:hypothetical protein